MADGLNMGSLTLNDSQHAPAPGGPPSGGGRAAYIPPHLRQRQVGVSPDAVPPPGPAAGSWGGPRYAFPGRYIF